MPRALPDQRGDESRISCGSASRSRSARSSSPRIQKLIWNDNMVLFQNMLLTDAFTNYRQIMADVTLSPAMGQYLDMANNAKANPRPARWPTRTTRAS